MSAQGQQHTAQNFVPKATAQNAFNTTTNVQTKQKITIEKISYRIDLQFQAHNNRHPTRI